MLRACINLVAYIAVGLLVALLSISASLTLQNLIVFLHPISYINPYHIDFENPFLSKAPSEKGHVFDILAPALRVFYPGLDMRLFDEESTKADRVQFQSEVDIGVNVDLGLWELVVKEVNNNSGDVNLARKSVNVFYSHGNAENRGSAHYRYDAFARVISSIQSNGVHKHKIVTYDYRGFGDSVADRYGLESDPEECLAEDARQAFDATGLDASKTILFGHSLGTVVSLRLALELSERGTPPAAVVLEAPVSDAAGICSHWLGGMFFESLLRPLKQLCSRATMINLSSTNRLRSGKIKAPIYILHGTNDMTIPHVLGQEVHESCLQGVQSSMENISKCQDVHVCDSESLNAAKSCRFFSFPGADHLDIFLPMSKRISEDGLSSEQILQYVINEHIPDM